MLQVQAGERPTIEPWEIGEVVAINPVPFHLSVIQDVSASMTARDAKAAQLVWALRQGLSVLKGASLTHVAFGTTARVVEPTPRIEKFKSAENTAVFPHAVRLAAEHRAHQRGVEASATVIVSDGDFPTGARAAATRACAELTHAEGRIFWVDGSEPDSQPSGVTFVSLNKPFACAASILEQSLFGSESS